jgi:LysM repeat protein
LNVTVRFDQYKPPRCYSNQTYTVAEGDTCKSISEKMSVDTGTLEILNNLYADCSNIVVGMDL